jgi:Na+-transporting NADH:ubiquinone oxidoreductase subunit B
MKELHKLLKKISSHFERDRKLNIFYPLFEALESFLFRMPVKTTEGAHVRDAYDIKRMMTIVIIALIPCAVLGIYNTGYQHYLSRGFNANILEEFYYGLKIAAPIFMVSYIVGGLCEVLFAIIRKHEINEGFLVTGFLIPLVMPPTIPLWQVALATMFGVILGKEVFGGTGMNIFNPALLSRAFMFFAYPKSISGSDVWVGAGYEIVDTYTTATPLAVALGSHGDVIESLQMKGYHLWDMIVGIIPGCIGETSLIAILIGAIILMITRVASARIILSIFLGGALTTCGLYYFSGIESGLVKLPPVYHLSLGGFAFGAVFMATDPVTGAATSLGKYIYGFLIGVLAILIRIFNPVYSEGMMLAILFMNVFAPLIDQLVVNANIRRRRKRAER